MVQEANGQHSGYVFVIHIQKSTSESLLNCLCFACVDICFKAWEKLIQMFLEKRSHILCK